VILRLAIIWHLLDGWLFSVMTDTAHFFIENDSIKINLPFNPKFIKQFRKNTYNTFIWNKQDKVYEAKFNTYAFRSAVKDCTKFFDISYCDTLKPIVELLESAKDSIFEPTLVRSNGNYYIACINESLYNQIKDLELTDSLELLYKCSMLSVKVHEDILANSLSKQFAANKTTSISKDMLASISVWLKELRLQNILISNRVSQHNSLIRDVFKEDFIFTSTPPYVYIATNFENATPGIQMANKVIILNF